MTSLEDRIYWAPLELEASGLRIMDQAGAARVHYCPMAVLVGRTSREALCHPDNLRRCRYCENELPA